MAISYQRLTVLSRSSGRSAVAATAYITRASLRDDRTGTLHTYTRARDVDPDGCGVVGWDGDAGSLANAMETAETRINSRTARLVVVALPAELTPAQQRELLRDYAIQLAAIGGTPAIYARHDKGDGNPHAHLVLSTRTSTDGRTLGPKARIWDDRKTGPECCTDARQAWIDLANGALRRAGRPATLTFSADPETVPQRHLGPAAAAMERQGERTEVGAHNRAVRAQNEAMAALKATQAITERRAAAAALRAAQEVEAAAVVVPPPLPPQPAAAPVRQALERPATATPRPTSVGPVRGSGTALPRPPAAAPVRSLEPDVSGWWPVVLGTAPGLRDPQDRARWLAPRIEVQAQQHTPEAIHRALWRDAPNNRRGAWLSLRGVAERAKSLTRQGRDWWDRLTRPPADLERRMPPIVPPPPVRPPRHRQDMR